MLGFRKDKELQNIKPDNHVEEICELEFFKLVLRSENPEFQELKQKIIEQKQHGK